MCAAVDGEDRSGDAVVGGEEEHGGDEVVQRDRAPERDAPQGLGHFGIFQADGRQHRPRRDGVETQVL